MQDARNPHGKKKASAPCDLVSSVRKMYWCWPGVVSDFAPQSAEQDSMPDCHFHVSDSSSSDFVPARILKEWINDL